MIYLGIGLFGFISLMKLPQELFPPITYPQLTVVTTYENAAPEEIDTLITKPVEEAMGTVSGLRRLKSISKEGLSLVIAEFGWSQNMDFAALRMREKIDLIKERLPRESKEPLVMKYNPFEMPIMTLSVTGDRPSEELREISRRIIKDELEKIEGVASASIAGGLEREIIVEVDQGRLSAQNIPLLNVAKAITDANLNYPAGTIKESFYEYLIRTLGEFEHVNEIEKIAVHVEKENQNEPPEEMDRRISHDKRLVLLKDVGVVYDTVKERTSYSRYNEDENISIAVQKQAQTNTLQVVNSIRRKLDTIRSELPKDVRMQVISDQSKFIKEAINGVKDAAIQGGFLAFLVLLIFLRNIRSSLIVTVSIPVSIIAVFTLMYMGKLSINMMSLGGLALGVGMLVDNAIVVLENITRHREEGKEEKDAAIVGAGEVGSAITSSTLTTIVVFFPMVFVVGIAGQIFKQLAFTVIFALAASLLVALTLIPLMASGRRRKSEENPQRKRFILIGIYEAFLRVFLKFKVAGLLLIILLFIASLFLFAPLDKELMPKVDQREFIVKIDMPSGTRLEITNEVSKKVEDYVSNLPYVKDVSTIVGSTRGRDAKDVLQRLGSNQAEIRVNLIPGKKETKTADAVQNVKNHLKTIDLEGADIEYILQESIFSAAVEESSPVVIEIKGEDMPTLTKIADKMAARLERVKGIYGIKSDKPKPSPETKVLVKKDRASIYNLSVADIAQTAQIGLKGYIASRLKEKGQEIDIRVRLREEDRKDFNKLSRLQIHSPDGNMVPLSTVARFGIGKGPSEIKRSDQERTILITANIFKRALKDVVSDVKGLMAELEFPEDFTVKLTGESEEMTESFNSLKFALIFSIVLVYMIMAGQFESFGQPFIIMATVPLSVIGVLLALFVTKTSINVVALLGLIMLGGIVVNNGIVLIDYLNLLRSKGMPVYEAVMEASKARLRPILMTAMTTILGLLPMALAFGEGSELRSPLAISVIGGLLVSTFLTLLVVPAIYLLSHEVGSQLFKK